MDRPLEPTQLLSTSEVARLLGVSSAAVSQWLIDGDFPDAYKLNPIHPKSPWRIPRANVKDFITKRRAQRGYFYVPPGGADGL